MRAPMIVKGEIATDRAARLADAIVGSQVDLLVFDASPQALDEHVVSPGASAVHADRDAMLQQHAGKVDAGELGGFKRSSQHDLCWLIGETGQAPLRVFSNQASFGAAS